VLVYSPEADANHDGLPDPGATPLLTIPAGVAPPTMHHRVPVLPMVQAP